MIGTRCKQGEKGVRAKMNLAEMKNQRKVNSFNPRGTTVVYIQNVEGVASMLLDKLLYRIENMEGNKVIVLVDKNKVNKRDTVQGIYEEGDIGKLRTDVIRDRYYGLFTTEIYATFATYEENRQLMGGAVNVIVYNFQQGKEKVNEGNCVRNIGLTMNQHTTARLEEHVYQFKGLQKSLRVKSNLYFINVQVGGKESAVVVNYANGFHTETLVNGYMSAVSVPLNEIVEKRMEATTGNTHALQVAIYLVNLFNAIVTEDMSLTAKVSYLHYDRQDEKQPFKRITHPITHPNLHQKDQGDREERYTHIEDTYLKYQEEIKGRIQTQPLMKEIVNVLQIENYWEEVANQQERLTDQQEEEEQEQPVEEEKYWLVYKATLRLRTILLMMGRSEKTIEYIRKEEKKYQGIAKAHETTVEQYSDLTGLDGAKIQKEIKAYVENLKSIYGFYEKMNYKRYVTEAKEVILQEEKEIFEYMLEGVTLYMHPKHTNQEDRIHALRTYIKTHTPPMMWEENTVQKTYETVYRYIKDQCDNLLYNYTEDGRIGGSWNISNDLKREMEQTFKTVMVNKNYLKHEEYTKYPTMYHMVYMEHLVYNFYLKDYGQKIQGLQA